MSNFSFKILLSLSFFLFACSEPSEPIATPKGIVEIKQGKLQGTVTDDYIVFKGVPYADTTAGENRWRAPKPPKSWEGIREATEYGAICPQVPTRGDIQPGPRNMSEECLFLNVWTPVDAKPGDKLPVIFWIHGGSFRIAAGSWDVYTGENFVEEDVILVTINYRMGHLGRFGHPVRTAAHDGKPLVNFHMMDQIAALEWVQGNIENFGGDKENVTIFGYSAGGVSVDFLMVMPDAAGLFHKAISQSSGVDLTQSNHLTRPFPFFGSIEDQGIKFAKSFGIAEDDPDAMVKLRALSMEDIIDYQANEMTNSMNPAVDGVSVPDDLITFFEEGRINDAIYMGGNNSWEGSIVRRMKIPPPIYFIGLDKQAAYEVYGELSDQHLAEYMMADKVFVNPTRQIAGYINDHGGKSYFYSFEYQNEAIAKASPGAAHADETPYIFGHYPMQLQRHGIGPEDITQADHDFGDRLRKYWINFAKTGDPNGAGMPNWPAYDRSTNTTMVLGAEFKAVKDYRNAELDFQQSRDEAQRARLASQ